MTEKPSRDKTTSPKGILKKTKQETKQRSFQWDEMNILATYHPADKTYGHMKIEEPKTPFVFDTEDTASAAYGAGFSAEDLAARLTAASHSTDDQRPLAATDLEPEDHVEDEHQRQFREKRRLHYNEFLAAKMAKERLEAEEIATDDGELNQAAQEAARNARINAAMSRLPLSSTPPTDVLIEKPNRSRSRSPTTPK